MNGERDSHSRNMETEKTELVAIQVTFTHLLLGATDEDEINTKISAVVCSTFILIGWQSTRRNEWRWQKEIMSTSLYFCPHV